MSVVDQVCAVSLACFRTGAIHDGAVILEVCIVVAGFMLGRGLANTAGRHRRPITSSLPSGERSCL